MIEGILRNFRLAVRSMRRSPGFATVIILTLALGVGSTTAIFSIVDALVLRPLPYARPERLVSVVNRWEGTEQGRISPAEYFDYLDRASTLESFGVYARGEMSLTGSGAPELLTAGVVSHGTLTALGVRPIAGRLFTHDDSPGNENVVILSHGLWQRRFGGEASSVGSKIVLAGRPHTVIGVMPAGFRLPFDLDGSSPSEVFTPLAIDRATTLERGSHFLLGIGRLRSGRSAAEASRELAGIARSFERDFPDDYPREERFTARAVPLHDDVLGSARRVLLVIFGSVLVVLMIACANVANLLVVRMHSRARELGIRSALGAERKHMLGHFLGEALVLSVAGGICGIAFAAVGIAAFSRILPEHLPRPQAIALDWRAALFALAVSATCALLTALIPALRSQRSNLQDSLQSTARGGSAARASVRFRNALVIAEIALTMVLSLAAGLLLRSLAALYAVDPGFRTDGRLSFRIDLPAETYGEDASIVRFYRNLMPRLAEVPGIAAVGGATNLPLATRLGDLNFAINGVPTPEGKVSPRGDWQAVTPGYFEAIGMQVVSGRALTAADDENASGALVINEALAKKYWPGTNPIGVRVVLGGDAGPGWVTIVGIVRDIRHQSVGEAPHPEMYVPHAQFRFWHGGGAARSLSVVLHVAGNPAGFPARIRKEVAALDPSLPVADVRTLDEVRAASLAESRFLVWLFSAFSSLSLLLSAVGVYGLLAFLVAERRREIGVRMALGAGRGSIAASVVSQCLKVVIPGVLAGLIAALLVTRLLAAMLYGVRPADPVTFATVPIALCAVALLATLFPALRASRVDPAAVLRD